MGHWWDDDDRGRAKYTERNCSSATLFAIDLAWTDLASTPNLRDEISPHI